MQLGVMEFATSSSSLPDLRTALKLGLGWKRVRQEPE